MRRNPDDPFDDIFNEIERMMENVMGYGDERVDVGGADTHVDVHEYDDRLRVVADLPGVSKEEIELQCDGDVLSIRATGESRTYDERVRLPASVDETSGSATYNNGVLEVTFERANGSANISVE